MSLTKDAAQLVDALNVLCVCLRAYAQRSSDVWFLQQAKLLGPLVDELGTAVHESRDREAARASLDAMAGIIDCVSTAITKGGITIGPEQDDVLKIYWELHTIFRELRYQSDSL